MMKYLTFFAWVLFVVSCKPKQNVNDRENPIIAENLSHAQHDQNRQGSAAFHNAQNATVYLLDDKKITAEKFRKLLNGKKIKAMEEITAQEMIEAMGHDYSAVKRIIKIKR